MASASIGSNSGRSARASARLRWISQDLPQGGLVRQRHLDEVVQAARGDQERADPVGAAGRGDNEERREAAQPVEQLADADEERGGRFPRALGRQDVLERQRLGILEEQDALALGARELEDLLDHLDRQRTDLRGEGRQPEVVEERLGEGRERLREQRLAVAGGPVEQPAPRGRDAPAPVEIRHAERVGQPADRRLRRLRAADHREGHPRARDDLHAAPEVAELRLELPDQVVQPALDGPLRGGQARLDPGASRTIGQSVGALPPLGGSRSAFSKTRSSTRMGTRARSAKAMASEGRASIVSGVPAASRWSCA